MYLLCRCIIASMLVLVIQGGCPHNIPGLVLFSGTSLANGLTNSTQVNINSKILLDQSLDVGFINIYGSGKLVLKPGIGHINIRTKGINVSDTAEFHIGSDDCRFTDQVTITLRGDRETKDAFPPVKAIFVQDDAKLHLHGGVKLSWTRLSATAQRFDSAPLTAGEFIHSNSPNAAVSVGAKGPVLYVFNADFSEDKFKVYNFLNPNNAEGEKKQVQRMIRDLNGVVDGQIVAISIQNKWAYSPGTLSDITSLLALIQPMSEFSDLELKAGTHDTDAYTIVFVKGTPTTKRCQKLDKLIGKQKTKSECHITHNNMKISAISVMEGGSHKKSHVDFRILSSARSFPYIDLMDDISTWQIGDEIAILSSDYEADHVDVRRIKNIDSGHKRVQLDGELEYRHVSIVEHGVTMRAEVILGTRNILIQGEMSEGCPTFNGNCDVYPFDTTGGHIKVTGKCKETHIQDVSLRQMGQMSIKGSYPVHFHMCGDVTNKVASITDVSIWNSYARCVTVHGTRGTDETNPGVVVQRVTAYNIYGHCFFTEDGAEVATRFEGCLGANIMNAKNGFATDENHASVFWITNPNVTIIGCVAAGADGFGIWYVFPDQPVGPSKAQEVFAYKEARNTRLYTFIYNIVHSNMKGGFNFDKQLLGANGNVTGCMNYRPLTNPLDDDSDWTWVYLERLTAYKNFDFNVWLRGGWFILTYFSGAYSRKCIQIARGSDQAPEVRNSVCVGRAGGNLETEPYPDAITDAKILHYQGFVVYDGPVYVSNMTFFGYENVSNEYVAGAIGFKKLNKFSSSAASTFKNIKYGFIDETTASRNRVFDGNKDDDGFGNLSGDESACLRDGDGSMTTCPGETFSNRVTIVKPEKFIVTTNCKYRRNWKMAICKDWYAKAQARVLKVFPNDDLKTFNHSSTMERVKFGDDSDTAYENYYEEKNTKPEFNVLLGSDTYYYKFQYNVKFPQLLRIEAKGIERNMPVVIGVCLPAGAKRSDLVISAASSRNVTYSDSEMVAVGSVNEMKNNQFMNRYHLDGRMLYFIMRTNVPRNEGFFAHDTDHCADAFCPRFEIEMAKNLAYTRCFTPTAAELSTDVHVDNLAKHDCTLPATIQDPSTLGWGAGDWLADVDGGFGEWGAWSYCCNENGKEPAKSTRIRLCDSPRQFGNGAKCKPEDEKDTKTCTTPCPVEASFESWQPWSDCFCDGVAQGSRGAQKRVRTIIKSQNYGEFVKGHLEEYRPCEGCQYN